MTPAEQFEAWRQELDTEIGIIERELAEARSTQESAEASVRGLKAEWAALNDFATPAVQRPWARPEVQPNQGVAGLLHVRLVEAREPLKNAEAAQATARAAVARLELRLASLRDALDQINRVLAANGAPTRKPALQLATPKRTPTPVDFDTIAPRGNAA